MHRVLNPEKESSEHLKWTHLEEVQHCTDLPLRVTVTTIISRIVMPLSCVDVVFCLDNYFRYSLIYKSLLIYFILEVILLVVISDTPPKTNLF